MGYGVWVYNYWRLNGSPTLKAHRVSKVISNAGMSLWGRYTMFLCVLLLWEARVRVIRLLLLNS